WRVKLPINEASRRWSRHHHLKVVNHLRGLVVDVAVNRGNDWSTRGVHANFGTSLEVTEKEVLQPDRGKLPILADLLQVRIGEGLIGRDQRIIEIIEGRRTGEDQFRHL